MDYAIKGKSLSLDSRINADINGDGSINNEDKVAFTNMLNQQ